MTRRARLAGLAVAALTLAVAFAASRPAPRVPGMPVGDPPPDPIRQAGAEDDGFPIENETVIARCERCHEQDDDGRMTRISYLRKTPEGWQTTIRRMVALNNVRLEPDEAREIVRYLANRQGLAPEELEPGRFEVERRLIEHDYEADDDVETTCIQCHSMGRVITQRRTREEWELLLATHRGLYPLADFQGFRSFSSDEPHPMEAAVDHLSEAFPLETPEWSAWSATMRTPRLSSTWLLSGFEPGKGRLFGTMLIATTDAPDEFETGISYTYAETGETVSRRGRAVVYTGHQWRGRSNPEMEDELREVMSVERGWSRMTGRWFRGAYDELGPDVQLVRLGTDPVVAGVYPRAVARGATTEVVVHGHQLPTVRPEEEFDFGPGVQVESVTEGGPGTVRLTLAVADDAPLGSRDLHVLWTSLADAIVVHDGVDRLEVTPRAGMARIGGGAFPKGHQAFDAIGWNDGRDGEAGTDDDLRLGRVPVTWSVEEYAATYQDDDVAYVGRLGSDGVFVPAIDGPNPDRPGNRNNVGDVWVVATYTGSGPDAGDPLRARANLIVTVPLYARFDPWQPLPGRLVP